MSVRSFRRFAGVTVACAAAAGAFALAAPAQAAQSVQQITCNGTVYDIRTNNNNSSDHGGWSAAQLVDQKGHGIPAEFAGTLVDDNTDQVLFSFDQAKGQGNANHNQATTTCTQQMQGTAGDFFGNEPLPPGVSANVPVTFTINVAVVFKQ